MSDIPSNTSMQTSKKGKHRAWTGLLLVEMGGGAGNPSLIVVYLVPIAYMIPFG